ncbi:MAG: MFS transporter [Ignavibacteria bacterium]|nr:MFS transporter [Ignavibacteria bacterium]
MKQLIALPQFRAYLTLRFFLACGWHMQALVVAWTVYAITKDPLMLGMVGLAEAIPAIGAALPVGYMVDRMNKKSAVKIACSLIFISAIGTGYLVQPLAINHLGQSTTIFLLLSMVVLNGFARSMYSPAMFAALSIVAPRQDLAQATAIGSGVWQAAMISGPLLGGIIYGQLGVFWAAVSTLISMCIGIVAVFGLPTMPALVRKTIGKGLRDDVLEGLRFIFGHRIILSALSLDLFAVLFGGAVAILPMVADVILHTDASGLGVLRAAPSIGSVLVMAFMSVRPPTKNTFRILLWSVTGFGIATIGFGLSELFWLSVIMLFFVGCFDSVSVVIRHTLLQIHTPDEMRGRVAAANTMFVSSSNEIGSIESGVAAKLIGLVPSIVFGGVMTLVTVGVVKWRIRD